MSKLTTALFTAACLVAPVSLPSCVTAKASKTETAAPSEEALQIDLKEGEILQLILVRSRAGETASAVRSDYFAKVVPVAGSLGGKTHASLPITETLIGSGQSEGISVFTFPNRDAQTAFRNSSDWETFKRMRQEGWEELHVFSVEIPKDMTLRFDRTKSYTIAAAWTRPGTLSDYQRYLDGIEADFDEIGASYVAQLNQVELQSATDLAGNPSQLTIVEWSDGPNLRGLQNTDSYKAHSGDFQKAVSRFDLYAFSAPSGR